LSGLLTDKGPQLVQVNTWFMVLVHCLVKIPHAYFTKVAWMAVNNPKINIYPPKRLLHSCLAMTLFRGFYQGKKLLTSPHKVFLYQYTSILLDLILYFKNAQPCNVIITH